MNDSSPSAAPIEMSPQAAELSGRELLLKEIGLKLIQARESSGESIEEAVRKLKLQKKHLLALESGNWSNMPDDIYILGFLRQYSQYLHVDLSDEIHHLKNDQYALTRPLTFPDPPVAPSRCWAWIAGIAFVILFLIFNITSNNSIDESAMMDTPHPAAGENGTVVNDIVESSTIDQRLASQQTTVNDEHKKPSLTITEAPLASTADNTNNLTTLNPATTMPAHTSSKRDSSIRPVNQSARQIIKKQPAVRAKTTAISDRHRFRFDAVGSPVWLQISLPAHRGTGKGRLLKEVLLQPNQHISIKARATALWITCGNAPALRIHVDGEVFAAPGSLGAGKKVLRNYRFSIINH